MPFESYELICTTSHDLLHGMFCNCNLSFNFRLGHHNLKVLDCTLKIGVVIENINAFNMWRRPQESVEQVLMFSREVFFYTSLYQVFEHQHRTVQKRHAVVQHQTI